MRVIYCKERDRFEADGRYHERFKPKNAGFCWDPAVGRWWTKDAIIANRLIDSADPATTQLIREQVAVVVAATERQIEASRALRADIVVPAPPGREYRAYQLAGIAYALQRPDTLIADEMGVGKTAQAIGVMNVHLKTTDRVQVLVVAPKIALANWQRELTDWLIKPCRIARWTTVRQDDADVAVINYDILSRKNMMAKLHAINWDIVVFDEAHMLKNWKAQRTRAALGDRQSGDAGIRAYRRLFLTGTPIVNRPIEFLPILRAMGMPEAQNYYKFGERFCNGHWVGNGFLRRFDVSGASNQDELQRKLRSDYMVRRRKVDVLTELPPKSYQLIALDASDEKARAAIEAQSEFEKRRVKEISAAKANIKRMKKSGDKSAYNEAVANLNKVCGIHFKELSRLRHETALIKLPHVVEHVAAVLDSVEDAVLVFAHHHDVIAGLQSAMADLGYDAAVITGETSTDERENAQADIQAGRKRLFIGSIRASGVAINLQQASTVVFAEQDWAPSIMKQCEDRAHRLGQRHSVLVQYLVLEDSIDARMAKMVVAKEGVIDKALDRDATEGTVSASPIPAGIELGEADTDVGVGADCNPGDNKNKGSRGEPDDEDNVLVRIEPERGGNLFPMETELDLAHQPTATEPKSKAHLSAGDTPAPAPPKSKPGRPTKSGRLLTKTERNRTWRKKSGRVTIEIEGDVIELLRKIREEEGRTTSDVLREALVARTTAPGRGCGNGGP